MHIYNSMIETIGSTPLVAVDRFAQFHNASARILAKVEFFNPCSSVKDRAALNMLEEAEKSGKIGTDVTIIEPTSGNTGIGLAAVAAAKGYKAVIVMPDSMSEERRRLLKAYGAQLVLTPGAEGIAGAIKKAEELHAQIPGSFIPAQFDNPDNPDAHYKTTAPEIYEACDGKVDVFVAGVGTGGTLTGIGRYLKEKNPDIKIVAVEPADSPILSGGKAGAHALQGIGANFVPSILDRALIDEIITVTSEQAFDACRSLVKTEGLLCGISGGAALYAAAQIASRDEFSGKNVVTLLPDSGERYLSTGIFD